MPNKNGVLDIVTHMVRPREGFDHRLKIVHGFDYNSKKLCVLWVSYPTWIFKPNILQALQIMSVLSGVIY